MKGVFDEEYYEGKAQFLITVDVTPEELPQDPDELNDLCARAIYPFRDYVVDVKHDGDWSTRNPYAGPLVTIERLEE